MRLRSLTCLVVLLSVLMTGGVWATWQYGAPLPDTLNAVKASIREFARTPDEVLPDEEEDTKNDVNHMAIMDEILFNSKMGLNMKIGAINNAVEDADILHYTETISGGNLKHLIDVSEGGKNIGFAFRHIDENSFYCYSFYRIGHKAHEVIEVYRTLYTTNTDKSIDVNDDGKWDRWIAVESQRGYATTIKGLKHMESDECSIDPTTWYAATAGSNESDETYKP